VDFQTSGAAGLEGVPDPDVCRLRLNLGESWFRTTAEVCLGIAMTFWRVTKARVFLISQDTPLRDAIDALVLIWAASDAEEWRNKLTYLPL
jgi:hypothetical protein